MYLKTKYYFYNKNAYKDLAQRQYVRKSFQIKGTNSKVRRMGKKTINSFTFEMA